MNSNTTFLRKLRHWGYQLFRGSLQGGATAVKAFVSIATAGAAGLPVKPLDLKETACVFVGAAALHAWDFISTVPLPDDIEPEVELVNVPDSKPLQIAVAETKTEKDIKNET